METSRNELPGRAGRSANDPWLDGRPPHIPTDGTPLPRVCLLFGDPGRIELAKPLLTNARVIGSRREFTLMVGDYASQPVAMCSTGIGGPSTEIALIELRRLGVDTFLRVGGMGALKRELAPGSITVVSNTLRESGAARFYDSSTVRIGADPTVHQAIRDVFLGRGEVSTEVTVLSCDSYYLGEGRPVVGLEDEANRRMTYIRDLGVDGLDMECETVFAIGRALGARCGALLAVHGNRSSDVWLEDFEPTQERMLGVALDAAAKLST